MRDRLLEAPWARHLSAEKRGRVERETRVSSYAAGLLVCQQGAAALHVFE